MGTVMTKDILRRAMSDAGGWNKKQLAALGIKWPPPDGWRRDVVGVTYDDSAVDKFVRLRKGGPAPEFPEKPEPGTAVAYVDGGCRPNPGRGAYGFVLLLPDGSREEGSGDLGDTTNNKAEYGAVVAALEYAASLGLTRLQVYSDSELVVRQMSGRYRVKHPGLRPLNKRALALCRRFVSVRVSHVPRHQNADADRLATAVLDRHDRHAGRVLEESPDLAVACPACGRPYENLSLTAPRR